jgi:hypothetical protein
MKVRETPSDGESRALDGSVEQLFDIVELKKGYADGGSLWPDCSDEVAKLFPCFSDFGSRVWQSDLLGLWFEVHYAVRRKRVLRRINWLTSLSLWGKLARLT